MINERDNANNIQASITVNSSDLKLKEYRDEEGEQGRAGKNKMRQGQPRNNWWIEGLKRYWEWINKTINQTSEGALDLDNQRHIEILLHTASTYDEHCNENRNISEDEWKSDPHQDNVYNYEQSIEEVVE